MTKNQSSHLLSSTPRQIFPGIFIFLASVRDVLFYFLKFLKKLKKIEYTDLRSKCSRIYSDTKLNEKQYHLEVVLISELYRFAVVFIRTSNRLQNDII